MIHYTQDQITLITDLLRDAEIAFKQSGGATKHFVRKVLLPLLSERGIEIVFPDQHTHTTEIDLVIDLNSTLNEQKFID